MRAVGRSGAGAGSDSSTPIASLIQPRAGIAPLITIPVPVIAVALTVAFTVPRGQRRAVWAAVGFNPRRGRGLLIAVLGPVVIIALSFGVAAAFGVVRFPGLTPGFGLAVLNLTLTIIIFSVVVLGEEIGWCGYLLFRVAELTSGRRAALVTGVFHAIFHLPLLLLTTTYQSPPTPAMTRRRSRRAGLPTLRDAYSPTGA